MGSQSSKPTESKVPVDPIRTSPDQDNKPYPRPTGQEYDALDKIASELPNVIDDESRQQVEDYKQACDNGKGPMVACFATGEYLSLFERKHAAAAELYRNVCFRPKKDKSPNGVLVDNTMAYPAGCFNLAKLHMTGKGGVKVDNAEAYHLFDLPHNPVKAMDLYQKTCSDGDSISCFTLATMLLRGDKVNKAADNVSPQEARGEIPLTKREHEQDRQRKPDDHYVIPRNPARAEKLLRQACDEGSHVTACHNLVVMYTQGDDGVQKDPEKADVYAKKTQQMMNLFGGF
eukprot:scaffold804_cov165-Amphora_coffeaeformis.AAC.26